MSNRVLPRLLALVLVGAVVLPVTRPAQAQPVGAGAAARVGAPAAAQRDPGRHDVVTPVPGPHHWRTVDRLVPVTTGPANDLHLSIDSRLYVPDNASRRTPQPAILMTHGFGLTKDSTEVTSTAEFFAAHGYVVLTYTSSGFGDSGGCVSLQSADYDVKSARQLITRVLAPRHDVKRDRRGLVIGTIGGSYGGGIQLPLAAADRRIRATIPGRTWNDLRYSLDPNNRVVPGDSTELTHRLSGQGVFKTEWTSLFYALGQTQPAMGAGGCPEVKTGSGDPDEIASIPTCPGYHAALCRTYERLSSTGTFDAASRRLIARASASTFLGRLRTPTLLVQGQSDTLFNLNDASATFTTLRRHHVPVGMIWNSGGHGGYPSQPGECEVYDGIDRSVHRLSHCYLTLRALGWMDHWLRGTKGGRGPAFTYYRDWVKYAGSGPNDEQYGRSALVAARRTTPYLLTADGGLVPPRVHPAAGTVSFINPSGGSPAAYSETSNFSGPASSPSAAGTPPRDVPGQFASFETAPLARPLTSVGIPSARLSLTGTNGQDTVFFAKLFDVARDGSAELIHRLITPVRVPAGAADGPVRIRLLGIAHRFGAGHRVRLVLCTTDSTSYNAKVADVLTVQTGVASVLRLPGRTRRAR